MSYFKAQGIKDIVRRALGEDIGKRDITTESIIPKDKIVKAILLAKENCVVCGLGVAKLVFKTRDNKIKFRPKVLDGQFIKKGKIVAQIKGSARSILTAERVALNFLSLLSGIATKTKEFVEAIKPYQARIMDTRKTIPGLRDLEKYAVRVGGGFNHRFKLDEMIMIKDNHLKVTQSYPNLPKFTENYRVEIEAKNLKEFKEALKLKSDVIMLDNMSIKDMKKAVKLRNGLSPNTHHLTPKLEASGGINLNNVREIAATGVEMISIGALTHSINSVDISLEIL